ncbi:MAG: hypothetical protein ACE5E1_02275 [Phycisphaerae bacterium]
MHERQTEFSAERLIELLRHQRTLHRRLRLLADRQKALVEQEDPEPLLTLLAERQQLVDGLVALNGKLAPFRRHWTECYAQLDEASRREVAEVLEEINHSLGAILKSDSRDSATLTARQRNMGSRLAAFDAGSRASTAYTQQAKGRGRSRLTEAEA